MGARQLSTASEQLFAGGRCLNAVWTRADITTLERLILHAIGSAADFRGKFLELRSHSIGALVKATGASERSVRRALTNVIDKGLLRKSLAPYDAALGKRARASEYALTQKLFDDYGALLEAAGKRVVASSEDSQVAGGGRQGDRSSSLSSSPRKQKTYTKGGWRQPAREPGYRDMPNDEVRRGTRHHQDLYSPEPEVVSARADDATGLGGAHSDVGPVIGDRDVGTTSGIDMRGGAAGQDHSEGAASGGLPDHRDGEPQGPCPRPRGDARADRAAVPAVQHVDTITVLTAEGRKTLTMAEYQAQYGNGHQRGGKASVAARVSNSGGNGAGAPASLQDRLAAAMREAGIVDLKSRIGLLREREVY